MSKQQLLDYVFKNVSEWNDDYDHIRSNNSEISVYYTKGDGWFEGEAVWRNTEIGVCDNYLFIAGWREFRSSKLSVISKEEYLKIIELRKITEPLKDFVLREFNKRNITSNHEFKLVIGINDFFIDYSIKIQSYICTKKIKISKSDLDSEEYKKLIVQKLIKLIGILAVIELENYLRLDK